MSAQRPRYLVITELFLPTKGGTAVWFDEVYRRLGNHGTHIVTADVPGASEHDANHPNTVHRIPLKRHWFLRPESVAMYLKLLSRSLRVVLGSKIDAVHAGRVLPEGLVGWVVARLGRVPLVVYSHGEEVTTWRQWAKFRVMRFTYRRADAVIANSEFTRDELLKLGVNPARIVLIHPGVDVERFRPGLEAASLRTDLGLGPGDSLVLSVGRLSRRKGFDQVIRALSRLAGVGCNVHYAIIGIGEDREYLSTLAGSEGVADRVHLLGHVASEHLPRWYNACNVFTMPNREINGDTEGFGMVFLEAAACGKPAIAGTAGGTGAAVVDNVTGLRIDGERLDQLVEALRRLLADDDLARQFGENGRDRAVRQFSWQAIAEKTVAAVSFRI
jgi:phosphatidylinositol alpha-1,6-mannosyltransferase